METNGKNGTALATVGNELAGWHVRRQQAETLVRSGFLPRAINTPEKALAVIQTGLELGLGPMQALRSIHIIEGKPTLSADLVAGLVHQRVPGATLRVAESGNERCVVEAGRPGQKPTAITWTMEDAQRAGLTKKDNWRKYPRAMLRARCLVEAARATFPDACMGLYTPDELGAVEDPETGEVEAPQPTAESDWHAAISECAFLDELKEVWESAPADVKADRGFRKHVNNKKAKLQREEAERDPDTQEEEDTGALEAADAAEAEADVHAAQFDEVT